MSKGCDNCYAMRLARRFDGQGHGYDGTTRNTRRGVDWTGVVQLHEDRLAQPLSWQKPRRVFVNSMSDLFHPTVPFRFVDKVFAVMALAPKHVFQILTKRPDRLAEYMAAGAELWTERWPEAMSVVGVEPELIAFPLSNVWLGTSVEDTEVLRRVDELRDVPAAVRFLSLEPLIGPLDNLDVAGIDWVIAGGESGHGARPIHPDWVKAIRDTCKQGRVPFFFKQWGAWSPHARGEGEEHRFDDGQTVWRVGKKGAGRLFEGQTWGEMPDEYEVLSL